MPHLHRLSEISRSHTADFQTSGLDSLMGASAYLAGRQPAGTVRDVLVDDQYGRIRYLLIDEDGGSVEGARLIPIGLARLEGDGVYFDDLTAAQLTSLHRYSSDEEYTFDLQQHDERVLRGTPTDAAAPAATTAQTAYDYRDQDTDDRLFKAPQTLQLLEERLQVNKEKYLAGQVEVGKRVETRTENVNVQLAHEEVVIERHAVSEPRPVEGDVTLGADSQTIRVDLEAERAVAQKQAYVTEEVEIGKRTETEQQTLSETVGKEVLEVNRSGDVELADSTPDRPTR